MVDGVDGLLIQPNTEALVDALEQVLADPSLRLQLASNFKSKVEANYTWPKVALKILSCFQ